MLEFFEGLQRRAAATGQRPAIVTADGALSYAALAGEVRSKAQSAARLPPRIGLLMANGADSIVCDLTLSFAGKEVVPLPEFFSDAQLSHIVQTAQPTDAVTDARSVERATRLGLVVHNLSAEAVPDISPAKETSRIIFTSGTTGKPKGVCLSGSQLLASVHALADATLASAEDRYLSVLPNSLLLEQIAGMYLPLSVGAAILAPGARSAPPGGQLALAAERADATATVLVPELLLAWLKELQALGRRGPQSLRFIAVGGGAGFSGTRRRGLGAGTTGLRGIWSFGVLFGCLRQSSGRTTRRHGRATTKKRSGYNRQRRDRRQRANRDERVCRRGADIGIVAHGRSWGFRR
jgi:long-chain acyl-CoA synthetase